MQPKSLQSSMLKLQYIGAWTQAYLYIKYRIMVKPRPETAWKSAIIVQWMLRMTRIITEINDSKMLDSKQSMRDKVCINPEESLTCQLCLSAYQTMIITPPKHMAILTISIFCIISPIMAQAIINVKKGYKFDRVYTMPRGMYLTEKNRKTQQLQPMIERIMSFLKLVPSKITLVSIFLTQIQRTLGTMMKSLVTSIISSMVIVGLD